MLGYLILAALALFIAVAALRTACFRPKPQPEISQEEIAFDKDAAVDALAGENVKVIVTVSADEAELPDSVKKYL